MIAESDGKISPLWNLASKGLFAECINRRISCSNELDLLGVYTLLGKKQDRDGFELKLIDLVKKRISPLLHDIEPKFVVIDGKTVCCIDVEPSKTPHYLDDEVYIRLGNQTQALSGRDLEDWLKARAKGD